MLSEAADDDGMRLRARLDDAAASKLRPFVVNLSGSGGGPPPTA